MKKLHRMRKILVPVLCFVLVLSLTGCGNPTDPPAPESAPETSVPADSEPSSETEPAEIPSVEPQRPEAKIKHSDFFMEVNRDWIDEQSLESGNPYISCTTEASELVSSRIGEMFEEASPEDFAEDDPMRKMLAFYRQLQEEGPEKRASMARIRELTDAIESQKNLEQFYKNVVEDPNFSLFNNLMTVDYMPCMDYRYRVCYYGLPLSSLYIDKTEEELQFMTDGYSSMLEELGYSAEAALSMAQNALKVDAMVWDYQCSGDGEIFLYTEGDEELQACTFPFIDIMKALGYAYYGYQDAKEYCFFASETYMDFMQKLFVPENLQMLKDYFVVCTIENLYYVGSTDFMISYAGILYDFMGVPREKREKEITPDNSMDVAAILNFDDGVVNKWYADKYVTDAQKEEVLAIAGEANAELQQIVDEIAWATPKTKRNTKIKIDSLSYYLGCYEEYNQLTDMEIGKTGVDTLLSLLNNKRAYNQVFLKKSGRYADTFLIQLSSCNSYYLNDAAAVVIGNGMLAKWELMEADASYEEKLGWIGSVIAHEISHAIDDRNFYLDRHLIAAEWFDEKHVESFRALISPIYEFYNGMTTDFGNTIEGGLVYNETYCDMVSMKCCLRLLASRENADYDAFFQSYAKMYAIVMTPEYEEYLLRMDSHVPHHERVNYLLAQFKEFYETYDIDENSPYFVPESKRIPIF